MRFFIIFFVIFSVFCVADSMNLDSINATNPPTTPSHEFSFYGLYSNADIVVKNVIWILSFFSILTWCVLICKVYQYFIASKNIKRDYEILKNATSFQNIKSDSNLSTITRLFVNNINDEITKSFNTKDSIESNLQSSKNSPLDSMTSINNANLKNRLKLRLENASSNLLAKMRLGVALLASIGSSAPFIGLFGTVWGIMNSFIGIAKADNASLAVVAPGIAEALFATAFGLVAAIPAVLFYNYLTRLGVSFAHKLDSIITMLYLSIDREFD